MKQIRTTIGINPASPENFYEEEGVYESYLDAESYIDETNEDIKFIEEESISENMIDDIIISNIENDDPYSQILKDVQ